MGIFYEMSGQVQIKPEHMDEAEKIVEEFNRQSSEDMEAYLEDGVFHVAGGIFTSYTSADDLDQIVLKLSPLVAEPGYIRTDCDDGKGKLYIGDPELEKGIKSTNVLAKIKRKVDDLTAEDKQKLIAFLTT